MKHSHLLLFLFIIISYEVNSRRKRMISTSFYTPNYLFPEENRETQQKLKLLTELVALNLAYHDAGPQNHTLSAYLENEANFILNDHNISTKEKVSYVVARYVLRVFNLSIVYEEHILRANLLDNFFRHYNGSGTIPSKETEEYIREEKIINTLALNEGQLAIDLLIQSFAPGNLYQMKGVLQTLSKRSITNRQIEIKIQRLRRILGIIKIMNIHLYPSIPLRVNVEEAMVLDPRKLYLFFEEKLKTNFRIHRKPLLDLFFFEKINRKSKINKKIPKTAEESLQTNFQWDSKVSTESTTRAYSESARTSATYAKIDSKGTDSVFAVESDSEGTTLPVTQNKHISGGIIQSELRGEDESKASATVLQELDSKTTDKIVLDSKLDTKASTVSVLVVENDSEATTEKVMKNKHISRTSTERESRGEDEQK